MERYTKNTHPLPKNNDWGLRKLQREESELKYALTLKSRAVSARKIITSSEYQENQPKSYNG